MPPSCRGAEGVAEQVRRHYRWRRLAACGGGDEVARGGHKSWPHCDRVWRRPAGRVADQSAVKLWYAPTACTNSHLPCRTAVPVVDTLAKPRPALPAAAKALSSLPHLQHARAARPHMPRQHGRRHILELAVCAQPQRCQAAVGSRAFPEWAGGVRSCGSDGTLWQTERPMRPRAREAACQHVKNGYQEQGCGRRAGA